MNTMEMQGILERHSAWLACKEGGERAVLTKANLRGANLAGADLFRAVFIGVDLSDADLREVDLWSADLSHADLSEAVLRGADLRHANLTGAVLKGADLAGANLSSACLADAYFARANLTGANLTRADLRGAYLTRADLRGACLAGADLKYAVINWKSRALVSEILFQNSNGDLERERWAAWIRLRTDLCWDDFLKVVPADVVAWGISVLSPWVTDEDNAPAILREAIDAAEAAEEREHGH